MHDVRLCAVEQLSMIGVPSIDPKALRHGGGACGRDVANGRKPDIFQSLDGGRVFAADCAASDNRT